jgi:hypothetical protein
MPAPYEKESSRSYERVQTLSALAASRGGKLLSESYSSSRVKLSWECQFGHTWDSSAQSVEGQSTWCPICAGNSIKSIDSLRELVEARGGTLLSTKYLNVDTTYDFKCSIGHEFSNSFSHVRRGQWCPICTKGSKSEEMARAAFQQIFRESFPKKRPKWLRNSRGRQMELDGYSETLGIAFEYQGIQHFSPSFLNIDLEQRITDDLKKVELCRANQVILMHLTHEMDPVTFKNEIYRQALVSGLDVSEFDFESEIDYSKTYIRQDRLAELKSLLALKGIQVLSKKWLSTDEPYEFRCEVCGHIWKARGNAFFNSRRVAGCDRCARNMSGTQRLLGMEELDTFAKTHGGKCLDAVYTRRNAKYKWECLNGHEFVRNFNNMKQRNQFCPHCN